MKLPKPTYDELFALVSHQSKMIFEQGRTIKRLEKKIAELEEKLKLNSKNSSKPPSTDQKPTNDAPKKKGGAKNLHWADTKKVSILKLPFLKTQTIPDTGLLSRKEV